MKKKMFVVDWAIFPFDILVCLGSDREEIMKKISQHKYVLSEEEKERIIMHGSGRTIMLEGGQTILWLKHYPKPGSGVLAHEVCHSIDFLLDRIGIIITDRCDELRAYMNEYLTNKIREKI